MVEKKSGISIKLTRIRKLSRDNRESPEVIEKSQAGSEPVRAINTNIITSAESSQPLSALINEEETSEQRAQTARFYRHEQFKKRLDSYLLWLQKPNSRPKEEIIYFKDITFREKEYLLQKADSLYQAVHTGDKEKEKILQADLGIAADMINGVIEGLTPQDLENIKDLESGTISGDKKAIILKDTIKSILSPQNIVHPIQLVERLKNTYIISGYSKDKARRLAIQTAAATASNFAYSNLTLWITVGSMAKNWDNLPLPIDQTEPLVKAGLIGTALAVHAGVVLLSNQIPKSDYRFIKASNGMSLEPGKVIAHALSEQLFPNDIQAEKKALHVAHWLGLDLTLPPLPRGLQETALITGDIANPIGATIGHLQAGAIMGGRIALQESATFLLELNKKRKKKLQLETTAPNVNR